jgi:hypothetical protein
MELLKLVASDPSLSACGYSNFQTLRMYHDGAKWIMEFEAVTPA